MDNIVLTHVIKITPVQTRMQKIWRGERHNSKRERNTAGSLLTHRPAHTEGGERGGVLNDLVQTGIQTTKPNQIGKQKNWGRENTTQTAKKTQPGGSPERGRVYGITSYRPGTKTREIEEEGVMNNHRVQSNQTR
jgi:hypothetical protein